MKPGISKDIRWFEGVAISALLFINLPHVFRAIIDVTQDTSIWMPIYGIWMVRIHSITYLLLLLLLISGIFLYLFKQKGGWFLLFANTIFFLAYQIITTILSSSTYLTHHLNTSLAIFILVVLISTIKKFNVTVSYVIFACALPTVLLLADFYRYRLAVFLVNLGN